jgi:hypothetical protein
MNQHNIARKGAYHRVKRAAGNAVLAGLLVLLASCSGDGAVAPPPVVVPPPPPAAVLARIEVTPKAVLLTARDATAPLTVTAYDTDGKPMAVSVNWTSSAPAVAGVATDGTVTAVAGLGSAQVIAELGGVRSEAVTVLIAQPVAGAILVSDDQVSSGPTPLAPTAQPAAGTLLASNNPVNSSSMRLDPNAAYGVGFQYQITLTGIDAPNVGDVLIGTGGTPVAGRVVEVVVAEGTDPLVTLELIAIGDLFDELQFAEQIAVSLDRSAINPELESLYDFVDETDGSISFIPRRETASAVAAKPSPFGSIQNAAGSPPEGTVALSGLECEWTLPLEEFPIKLSTTPTYNLSVDFYTDINYDALNGFQWLIVTGEPLLEANLTAVTKSAISTKIGCSVELAQLPIPIGGPLSFFFGGFIPVGFKFEFGGEIALPDVGFNGGVKSHPGASLGVDCSEGCKVVAEFVENLETKFDLVYPNLQGEDALTITAGIEGYLFADLAFGSPALIKFMKAAQFKAFKLEAGAAQSVTLLPTLEQANDDSKASEFGLDLKASIGTAPNFQEWLGLLGLQLPPLVLESQTPLARSPTGQFAITPGNIAVGSGGLPSDFVTFSVQLDSSTYLGLEAVDAIEFRWMKDGQLQPGRPGCTTIPAVPGQTTFTCETNFLAEHAGVQTFHAFMRAKLFGIPLPGLIEVSKIGKAQVGVATGTSGVQGNASFAMDAYFSVGRPDGGASGLLNMQSIVGVLDSGGINETMTDSHSFVLPGGGAATASYTSTLLGAMTGTPDAVWGFSASGSLDVAATYTTSDAREQFLLNPSPDSIVQIRFDLVGGPVHYNLIALSESSGTNSWELAEIKLFANYELVTNARATSCTGDDTVMQQVFGGPPNDFCSTFVGGTNGEPVIPASFSISGTLPPASYLLTAELKTFPTLYGTELWHDVGLTDVTMGSQASYSIQIDFTPVP